MKKYSAKYFEKKFNILFDKLLIKDGFTDEIKNIRKKLGIPEDNGFKDTAEMTDFFFEKINKKNKFDVTFIVLAHQFEIENHKLLEETEKEAFLDYFDKNKDSKETKSFIKKLMVNIIEDHNNLFSGTLLFRKIAGQDTNNIVIKILNKYWGFDLLDERIIANYIEKYLFLGKRGVNFYISEKVRCPGCRYIGVDHFSPERNNMQGTDKGPFSKNYIFNQGTVKLLSSHFNSVFLIIKPYATKEQVLNYIDDNWDWLKEHLIEKNKFYKQFDVNPSKIKESNFNKNKLVYSLYKQSKKELTKIYEEIEKDIPLPKYKESIISAILEKKYSITMSSEAIKKSANRYKKSKQIKTEPIDIRDI